MQSPSFCDKLTCMFFSPAFQDFSQRSLPEFLYYPLAPAANGIWAPLMLQLLRSDYFGPNSILEHFSKVINSWFFYLEHLNFNHGFTSSWLLNLRNYLLLSLSFLVYEVTIMILPSSQDYCKDQICVMGNGSGKRSRLKDGRGYCVLFLKCQNYHLPSGKEATDKRPKA